MVISDLVPGAVRGTSPVDPNHVGSLMQSWVGSGGGHTQKAFQVSDQGSRPEVVGKAGRRQG